ncbi:MAG: hypothetical protein JRN15_23145 [Nitrososphaerota archaeon]|nr:hypothetical protein [Nitrososphaerota archaeon]
MSEYAGKIALGVTMAVIVGAVFVVGLYYLPQNSVSTYTATSSSSTKSYIVTLVTQTSETTSGETPLCAGSGVTSNFQIGDRLTAGANYTATILCVEYYYYGPQQITFNTTSQLRVFGARNVTNGLGTQFDASSNFSIYGSPAIETIGGATNENEGAIVLYTINPKVASNGTYWLNLGWISTPDGQVIRCGTEFKLVSGNGLPDYTPGILGLCEAIVTMSSSTSANGTSATTTLLPPPYPDNTLVAKIVVAENSTS